MRSILLGLILFQQSLSDEEFCPDVCGEYPGEKNNVKNVQVDCTAYENEKSCPSSSQTVEEPQSEDYIANKAEDTRIVNGEKVEHPLPWMVALLFTQELCGGTLINSRFVLTAAHCSCVKDGNLCSRRIGEVKDEPITVTEDQDIIKESLSLYIGATAQRKETNASWTVNDLYKEQEQSGLLYKADKMFVHPLLSTSEKLKVSPDILLIRLEQAVKTFSQSVNPICLPKPEHIDIPTCPDNSVNRRAIPSNEMDDKASIGGRILGGCGIVAGWGGRYSQRGLSGSSCSTMPSPHFPGRSKYCTKDVWLYKGKKKIDCVKNGSPLPKDLKVTCKDFVLEVNFQEAAEGSQAPWENGDYNTITKVAPVLIFDEKKNRNHTCSTIDMDAAKERFKHDTGKKGVDFPGWCATEVDKKKRIVELGICEEKCRDEKTGINFANMNILTADECSEIMKLSGVISKKKGADTRYNEEYEMCAGKKNMFPSKRLLFVKLKKSKKELKKEKKAYKKLVEKLGKEKMKELNIAPRKFKYIYQGPVQDFEGLPDGYKYEWYLGGGDTCQGDSGGPIWRNIKVEGKMRATQLGVVSRGQYCAAFNQAGLYTRVTRIYDWIKETVKKNADNTKLCPKRSSWN